MSTRTRSNHSPSLFGPIVLIAVGTIWLLANFGFVETLHWDAVLRLWPLALVFAGLNLIVQQAPRPLGSLLSALLGLVAVGVFVLVLLFADLLPIPRPAEPEVRRNQPVSVALGSAQRAEVQLDLGRWPTAIAPLPAGNDLLSGRLTFQGELDLKSAQRRDTAEVRLAVREPSGWFLNPGNWSADAADRWELGLSPAVPIDLQLNLASGSSTVDLRGLMLEALRVDVGSGQATLWLPDGRYPTTVNAGSGRLEWTLPAQGSGDYTLDAGSGAIVISAPTTLPLRVELERGSGTVEVAPHLRALGERGGRESWESAAYATSAEPVRLVINGGSGALVIQAATGR